MSPWQNLSWLRSLLAVVVLLIPGLALSQHTMKFGFFRAGQKPVLAFSTSSQSILSENCSGIVTVQNRVGGTATNVGSSLTVNLSTSDPITFYSDVNCTVSISSALIGTGTNSTSFYFLAGGTGGMNYSVAATGYTSVSQSATVTTSPYVWLGGGGNANWSTGANWSGGAAPPGAQVAIFNSSCVTNCNPSISVSASVGGVRILSGFNGTITLGSASVLSVGSSAWYQNGGTFTIAAGGQVNVDSAVHIIGGTFNANSGTVVATTNCPKVNIGGTSTFNAGTGTFSILSSSSVNLGSANFNNVILGGTGTIQALTSPFTLYGTLTLNGSGFLNGQTINAKGDITLAGSGRTGTTLINVSGSTNQNITGSGSASIPSLIINSTGGTVTFANAIVINGSFTHGFGTVDTGTSTLTFYTPGSAITITPGPVTYNNVTFSGGGPHTISGTMNIAGVTTLTGGGTVDSGTLDMQGNLTAISGGQAGTAALTFSGWGNSTISQTSGSFPTGVRTVSKSSGNVVQGSVISFTGANSLNVVSGNWMMSGFNLTVASSLNLNNNSITKGGGVLSVNSSTIGTGALLGGTVNP